jgi:hypothetical protein
MLDFIAKDFELRIRQKCSVRAEPESGYVLWMPGLSCEADGLLDRRA